MSQMEDLWKNALLEQFGATIETLRRAIDACPDDIWSDDHSFHQYWYMVHHTVFWLDYYLETSPENYVPRDPFGMVEVDPNQPYPETVNTKQQMTDWLDHGKEKFLKLMENFTPELAGTMYKYEWLEVTMLELLLYNMRHVQHHSAQLNMILRLKTDSAPEWVGRAPRDS